jgi:hypothetical protein
MFRKNGIKIKFIISCVALVASVAAGAAGVDTGVDVDMTVDVEHLENGETKFNCRNRGASLTKTNEGKFSYKIGNLQIHSESIHIDKGSSVWNLVLQNDFDVNISMTDEEVEEAMNGVCRNEPPVRERGQREGEDVSSKTYSWMGMINRDDGLVSGQLYRASAIAFRDLTRSAATGRKDGFYVEIGGSKTTSSSHFDSLNIILGFPKVRVFGNLRPLIGYHRFSDISFSESGANYKISHELKDIGIFSTGLYGRWSIFNDNLHADSFIYLGYYRFQFNAECNHVVEELGSQEYDLIVMKPKIRSNLNLGIRLGFDYDIWINSGIALRPGLHIKFLNTGPGFNTTTTSVYGFSEHQLGYEPSLNFDFNLYNVKTDLFVKYDGVFKNSNGEAEERRRGSVELGANFGPASGKGGFNAGISCEFREKKDQSVAVNIGYGF